MLPNTMMAKYDSVTQIMDITHLNTGITHTITQHTQHTLASIKNCPTKSRCQHRQSQHLAAWPRVGVGGTPQPCPYASMLKVRKPMVRCGPRAQTRLCLHVMLGTKRRHPPKTCPYLIQTRSVTNGPLATKAMVLPLPNSDEYLAVLSVIGRLAPKPAPNPPVKGAAKGNKKKRDYTKQGCNAVSQRRASFQSL